MNWVPGQIVTTPTPEDCAAIQAALSPEQVCGITAWREAEARLEKGRWVANPIEAMLDILSVIGNRAADARWKALGHKGVCLQKLQFSCWQPLGGSNNHEQVIGYAQRLMAGQTMPRTLIACIDAARALIAGQITDRVAGACHYHVAGMPHPPAWAFTDASKTTLRTPTVTRFGHAFYAGIR